MALYPHTFSSRDTLAPGSRGEYFKNNGIPGHRTDDQRINRTHNALLVSEHDTLNTKYMLDSRLKPLFRYGWAYGYNQIVIPKGRIVAADPHLTLMDTDTKHYFNALTLANGGDVVEMNQDGSWIKSAKEFIVDETDGKAVGADKEILRDGNVPLGMLGRNEYTRASDAFNGIMPGPIWTDKLVDMPWFESQSKAEENPWSSIYGSTVKPGSLVKADANGRMVISPLSDKTFLETATAGQIELERQQVIGTVYSTDKSLLPEGAARFAQWSLEDRRNFEDFNPHVYPTSNRPGEDFVSNPPAQHQSTFEYPGYPYEKGYAAHDLHMLASSREGLIDPRLGEDMRLDRGIPGLTDGGNHAAKEVGTGETLVISNIVAAADIEGAEDMLLRLPETAVESAKVRIGDSATVSIVDNATITVNGAEFVIVYSDMHKGLFSIKQTAAGTGEILPVKVSYFKKGLMAGVPTMLDWDGCVGIAQVLLQK